MDSWQLYKKRKMDITMDLVMERKEEKKYWKSSGYDGLGIGCFKYTKLTRIKIEIRMFEPFPFASYSTYILYLQTMWAI